MNIPVALVSLVFLAIGRNEGIAMVKRDVPAECTGGYEKITGSTMCLTDSPNYVSGSAKMSAADKQIILDTHNTLRAGVSPEASNMMKMYWDDKLAKIAEKWAKQCQVLKHDSNEARTIAEYGVSPGQNGAFGQSSWKSAINSWYSEVSLYTYGVDPANWKEIGHYTQVVQGRSVLIGCGYAECNNLKYSTFYYCNYLIGNANLKNPYKTGTKCSSCKTCKDNLCDCGDLYCFHGGKFDASTCTCTCKTPWTDDKCLTKNCGGVSDPGYCGKEQPYGYPKSFCTKFANVPGECPVMCGICPAS